MYWTYNEGRSVIAERFIRTLKNKIYTCMTSISKNVYIEKLYDMEVIDHGIIKAKPADVTPSIHIDFIKENNKEGPKFKIGVNVRISKYKNIFAKGYVSN